MIQVSVICDICKMPMNNLVVVLDGTFIKVNGRIIDSRASHYCLSCVGALADAAEDGDD